MALIGLVDNQYEMVSTNIVLESMYSDMYQEPQETQEPETFEQNELPQLKQTSAPMGSDDITISEELEQVEDESPPDATAGCNDSLTRKEINEKDEPSPEPFEASEAELEPEKEKP